MPKAWMLIVSNILSGSGLGLLAWLGVTIALLHARGSTMAALHGLYAWSLGLGVLLVVTGAWAAPTAAAMTSRWRQWRTAWRARADVAVALTLLLALLVGVLLLAIPRGPTSATALGMLAIVLAIAAIAAATSSAMALSGQVQVPAWRHQLVLPLQLLCTLLGGLALLFAAMSLLLPGHDGVLGMLGTLAWLGLLLVAGSAAWWVAIARGVADAPATAASRNRRLVVGGLLLGAPLVALGLAAAGAGHGPALVILAAIAINGGIALWLGLLFDQAPDAAFASA